MTAQNQRSITPWLPVGDWLVLLAFVFIGQRDHDMNIVGSLPSLFTTTLLVALPWTVAAWLLGVLRLPGADTLAAWFGRVLAAWLIAAPLGLVLRALLRGQNTIMVPFMLVMLGLGGLTMLAWRVVAVMLAQRRQAAA